ncbi:MAG: VCBS repeat-containing protein [Planctomycetota bacterium]
MAWSSSKSAFTPWVVVATYVAVAVGTAPAQDPGSLRRLGTLPFQATTSYGAALGDLDGDGALDALTVGFIPKTTGRHGILWRGDAGGDFVDASTQLPANASKARDVALGDVDGDGDLDAILALNGDPRGTPGVGAELWLNDGTGRFIDAPARLPASVNRVALAVAMGDVDGDGDLDALFGQWGRPCLLFINDGSGQFTDQSAWIPQDSSVTEALALVDLDGDGDLDAVLANGAAGAASRVWANNGTGHFSRAFVFPFTSEAYALDTADIDADGDADVLFGLATGAELYVNLGNLTFVPSTQIPAAGASGATRAVALADVDGDGRPDALIGGQGSEPNEVWHNLGGGAFALSSKPTPPLVAGDAQDLAIGDVDRDGDPDVLIATAPDQENRLWLNDGTGGFLDVGAASARIPGAPRITQGAAAVDVDADSDLDLVLTWRHPTSIWENDGSGRFTSRSIGIPGRASVAVGDVDGDRDPDLLFRDALAINSGNGSFAPAPLPAGRSPGVRDYTLTDLDGDGDLDVVVARFGPNEIWWNDGAGVFSLATGLPQTDLMSRVVVTGDVDGDNDQDVIFVNEVGYSMYLVVSPGDRQVWRNDGAGGFTEERIPDRDQGTHADLVDFDLDGDLDLFLLDLYGAPEIWQNDSSGTFTFDATRTASLTSTFVFLVEDILVRDLDTDGDFDLLGVTDSTVFAGLNDGTGHFVASAPLPIKLPPLSRPQLVAGDFDSDGDGDVVITLRQTDVPPILLTSVDRQLVAEALPTIGRPVTVSVRGSPGDAWGILSAAAAATTPLGTIGILRLGAPLVAVTAGTFDATGADSMTFPVPPWASLIGKQLQLQMVTAPPLRLGNREPMQIRGF